MKGILRALSPTLVNLATSSNPIAGMVVKMAAKKLGMPDNSSLEQIEETVEREPEKASLLAQTENELKAMEINLEGFKVETEDRQDARKMQTVTRDWTPKIFAVMALSGFLVYCFLITVRPPLDAAIPNLIIGALTSLVSGVSAFYFGSTHNGNK
jgi:hypothetical protein